MKPVDLTPVGSGEAAVAPSGGGNRQAVGIGVGVVAVIGVAGFFGFAHYNDVKSQTVQVRAKTEQARAEKTAADAEIADLGAKPEKQTWEDVAVAYRADVIDKVGARADFPQFTRDLARILPAGSWLESVEAGDIEDDGSSPATGGEAAPLTVTIVGYSPDLTSVESIVARINALPSMEGAEAQEVAPKTANNGKVYRQFTIVATLNISADAAESTSDSQLASDAPASEDAGSIALTTTPTVTVTTKASAPKPVAPPDPLAGLVKDTGAAGRNG